MSTTAAVSSLVNAFFDRDRDGLVSRLEWDGTRAAFERLDLNQDYRLSRRELSRGAIDSQIGEPVGTSGEMVYVDGQ